MSLPRVRTMVLFKHGVAYIERSGPASGPFELSFKKDEMNDVLKSLSVWVAKGTAKIGALAFEKPEDPEQALAARKLDMQPGSVLSGLLWRLRGRRVVVHSAGQTHEGEVIGVENAPGREGEEKRTVVLRGEGDALVCVDLGGVTRVEPLDPTSRADLAFLADRSRAATAGDSRTVSVDVQGEAEDLRVSYVIPAPTWRVSYRVAREGDETLLMAWGIVHNPADEDLEAVDLVLTTGQPVSFVIDLYNPRSVRRAVVEEQVRGGSAPTRLERSQGAPPPPPQAAPPPARAAALAGGGHGLGAGFQAFAASDLDEAPTTSYGGAAFDSIAQTATYADRGELFEYRVQGKVALKRGGSAMVPLLMARIPARKERIWRSGSAPAPDLVLAFDNASGAVLEEGPAVVYDEGVYAGEAMVSYSARGAKVLLGFAKDLAVRCKETTAQVRTATQVFARRGGLYQQVRIEVHHELTVESDHGEPVDVIFEMPKIAGRTIPADTLSPFEDTLSFHRFKIAAPARGRAKVAIVERWMESVSLNVSHLGIDEVGKFVSAGLLDENGGAALRAIVTIFRQIAELGESKRRADSARTAAYQKQQKLSEQLAVLRDGGAEGSLRLRYVQELEGEQNKVNAAEAEIARVDGAIETAQRDAAQRLAKMGDKA
ncbi:hypothetical protein BH09MYX1_BH09MYX1_03430 [soil metagenome]